MSATVSLLAAARRDWSDLSGPSFAERVELRQGAVAVRGRMDPPDRWQVWRREGTGAAAGAVMVADRLPSLEACRAVLALSEGVAA